MRNWITFLMTLLVGSTASFVSADYMGVDNGFLPDEGYGYQGMGSKVSFEAGYRRDNISWSARVPASHPSFKTTSRFKDLDIFQVGIHARTGIGCNFYARAAAHWGWLFDGDFEQRTTTFVHASDFSLNCSNDLERFASEKNLVDDKYVIDVGAAIGYPFSFCCGSVTLAPVIGYAFNEQNIWVDGNKHGHGFGNNCGSGYGCGNGGECCRDKSILRWYGPFIGLDFAYSPYGECWSLFAELEYHYAHFKNKRHDNFGFDLLDNFNKTIRRAHGWVIAAGADYDMGNCWTLGLSFKFQDWKASKSHRHDGFSGDFAYLFSSSDEGCCSNRFRTHAKWHSGSINVALGYQF